MDPTGNTLLAAKFHRPTALRHQVPRPELMARLDAGLAAGRPLTLISAPAGYGKSTLAAQWAAQLGRPVAWLSLDEADDDPVRFFAYFVAALQGVDATVGAELTPTLRAGQLPPRAILATTLLNDLQRGANPLGRAGPAGLTPIVCVLDDFHVIQDGTIPGILQDLLAHPPTGLHLALVTREDPALPLARLRARDQLTEVRAADLRFTAAEIAAFLRDGMGLALTEGDLARLAERTEGWATGLQLAGLSMQRRDDPAAFVAALSGSHRFILSYLTEEVLARQPGEVQEFLLQTSILTQLSGDLCDAVRGISDSTPFVHSFIRHSPFAHSQAILEYLERANVFLIPLDDEGRWYRYHHLFAELLRNQLRRGGAEPMIELHRRASQWYEAQAMPVEAIGHAAAAGEAARVVALLERNGWALLNDGYTRTLEGWLDALPAEWRSHSPRISLDFGWMRLLRGNLGQVAPYLAQAEAALARLEPAAAPAITAWRAECLALHANLLQTQGRAAEAADAAGRALGLADPADLRVIGLASLALGAAYRLMPDFDRAAATLLDAIRAGQGAGDRVTEMLAVAHLTLMALQYGRLRFAAEVATTAIERLARSTTAPPPIVGAVHGALGLIYFEWNQVEEARAHLQRGIRLGAFSGHNASAIYSLCNLARLLQAAGGAGQGLAAAGQALDEAAALLAQGAPGWVRPELIGRQVCLALAQGDRASADARLRASGVAADDPVTHQTDAIHLAWLRLLAAGGDARAAGLAQRIIRSAEAGGRNGTLLQALVLAARLHAGEPRTACAYLAQALALAEPEGAIRVFLDEGEAMRLQIANCRVQIETTPRLKAFNAKLLAAFGEPAIEPTPQSPTPSPHPPILIEPLSERELEVLRLLAQGLKYAEIADRLVVSLNTVRFHVKEVYGKLGVNRQAHAVERARDLGLI